MVHLICYNGVKMGKNGPEKMPEWVNKNKEGF